MSIAVRRFQRSATGSPPEPSTFNPGAAVASTLSYAPPADAIYVSLSGNDTNGTGAIGSPYATIRKALTVAASDKTIVVRAGTYHEGAPEYSSVGVVGINNALSPATANLTVQPYPGETVMLDGAVTVGGWTTDTTSVAGRTVWRAPFVTITNRAPTEVRGETTSSEWPSALFPEFPIAHWPELVTYDGIQLQQVETLAEVTTGTFFVVGAFPAGGITNDFQSSEYIIGSDPTGHTIKISNLARAFINIPAGAGLTLRGLTIQNYNSSQPDWGTCFFNSKVTLEHCVFQDISNRGVQIDGNDATIRHCTFRHIGMIGIGRNGDRMLVEHSLFYKLVNRRFRYTPDAGAIKLGRSHGSTFRHNLFDTTYAHSLWLDQASCWAQIYGNVFRNSYGVGVMTEISEGSLVIGNIFINNGINSTDTAERPPYKGEAIRMVGSNNCYAWNNTIWNADVGITWSQDVRWPYNEYINTTPTPSAAWDPAYNLAWYKAHCTWDVMFGSHGNNVVIGGPNSNSSTTYSTVVSIWQQWSKTYPLNGGVLTFAGNLYGRVDASHPSRFSIGYPDGTNVKIYPSMVYTGGGTYDPTTSWKDTYDETGSAFITQTASWWWANQTIYQLSAAALASATPASLPVVTGWGDDYATTVNLGDLLAATTFTQQGLGAGHLDAALPLF